MKYAAGFVVGLVLAFPVLVAAQSSSPSYRLEESYFGTGGEVDASSPNFRSQQSTGSLGVGQTSSNNFDAVSGFTTPSEPFLEMVVSGADIDFGTFSPSVTSFSDAVGGECACTFYVRSYLSSDYSIVTASQSLTSENGDTIEPKASQGAPSSDEDVEEFGINLVANTVPGAMGANPENVPDNTFANGQAATGYEVANQYKYANGDIIAVANAIQGNQGVGRTNFTISYIAKSSNITEAGQYTMQHVLVVVPTF